MAYCPAPHHDNYQNFLKVQAEIGKDAAYALFADLGHIPENVDAYIKNYKEQKVHDTNLSGPRLQEKTDMKLKETSKTIKLVNNKYMHQIELDMEIQRVSELVEMFKVKMGTDFKHHSENRDFYAKKGTVVHKILEYIFKDIHSKTTPQLGRIQSEVTAVLKKTDEFKGESDSFFRLTPAQFKMLVTAAQEIYTEITSIQNQIDKSGTLNMYTEQILFDENNKRAGTADLIFTFSDGSGAMFDFKTFKSKKGQAPSTVKQEDWAVQMGNYASMLRNNYGVSSLRMSRVIPIAVGFDSRDHATGEWIRGISEGFRAMSIYTRKNDLKHLKPIPMEEDSRFKSLQQLVKKQQARKSELLGKIESTKIASERIKARQQLRDIDRSLQELLVEGDAEATLRSLQKVIRHIKTNLHKGRGDEGYLSMAELVEANHEMGVYENLPTYFKDIFDSNEIDSKKKAAIRQRLQEAATEVSEVKQDIFTKIVERSGGEALLTTGQGISNAGKLFHGLENWHIPIFQKLDKILKESNERARLETESKYRKIQPLIEKYLKWAKANGYRKNPYSFLLDPDTKKLVQAYNDDFLVRRNKVFYKANLPAGHPDKVELTAEDKAWIKENFEIDTAAVEAYESQLKADIQREKDRGGDPDMLNKRLEAFYKFTDPRKTDAAFYKGIKSREVTFLKPSKNAEKFRSKRYQEIQSIPEVREFYNYYQELLEYYREHFGLKTIGHNFVPIIHQKVVEGFLENGLSAIPDTLNRIKQAHRIREHDETVGVTSTTGEKVKQIPLLYVDSLRLESSASERAQIEAEVAQEIDPSNKAYRQEVARRVARLEYKKGAGQQSMDLGKSMMLFISHAEEHIQHTQVEDQVKGLQLIAQSEYLMQKQTGKNARTMFNNFINSVATKLGAPDLNSAFNLFVDRLLYKQQYKHELFGLEKYSSNKIAQTMMNMFSLMAIGANLILVGSNYNTARFNMRMLGRENVYFDSENWDSAIKWFGRRYSKYQDVYDFVQPTTRDYLQEKALMSGVNFFSRHLRSHTTYKGHILGDDRIDTAISVAMAQKYRVDSDGKIKNPTLETLINKDAPTLADSIQRREDGYTYVEGLTIEELAKFRGAVRKVAQRVKGMTNPHQKGLIYSYMGGSLFMNLRSWMPGMATTRFGRLEYDTTLGSLEQGRFAVAIGEVMGRGVIPALQSTMSIMTEAATLGLYKHQVNVEAVDAKMQRFINEIKESNPEIVESLGNTQEERRQKFIALHRAKLNSLISELRVYLAFVALLQLLGGINWDDEEEGNLFTWNAVQLTRRALLEISFWMSPTAAGDIIRSPFPLMSLLGRLSRLFNNSIVQTGYFLRGERDPQSKVYPFYYTLKTVPIVNQGLNIMHVFDPPNRKKNVIERIYFDTDD